MEPVSVTRTGSGPEVLLVHGGASSRTTWSALMPLAERWTLAELHRRGYPPSPAADGGHDFEVDADDIEGCLDSRPHVVCHSYGGLGALIAACRRPELVRSLTLIESPLYGLVEGDAESAELEQLGNDVLSHGLDVEPERLRQFVELAGGPDWPEGPIPDEVAYGIRRAHGGRFPTEARPDVEPLRAAGVPCLVASGDHAPGLETVNDQVAEVLRAERLVLPGAGHFVQAAPCFSDHLERFLRASS